MLNNVFVAGFNVIDCCCLLFRLEGNFVLRLSLKFLAQLKKKNLCTDNISKLLDGSVA